MAESLVASIEGPLGTAEIYEVTHTLETGALCVAYEVRAAEVVQKFEALGAAYIAAGELTGAKT